LKRAVGVYCGPFVLSNVEAWTARNTLTKRVNEKSRAPFDKLRTNGIFHRQTALFRLSRVVRGESYDCAQESPVEP
ncbi:hypothetical protein, partial [Methylomonas koyamae]|uniref:hypothetical protein n=1 Tax=Methylomonas koyamae TaxID=702114 RepID=UPI001E460A50